MRLDAANLMLLGIYLIGIILVVIVIYKTGGGGRR